MMMRALAGVVLLAVLLCAAPAEASRSFVLPPTVQPRFEAVMESVNERGALGPRVQVAGIAIEKDHVVIVLDVGDTPQRFVLTHPDSTDAAQAGPFRMQSPAGAPPDVVRGLRALVTEAFEGHPGMTSVSDPTDPSPGRPGGEGVDPLAGNTEGQWQARNETVRSLNKKGAGQSLAAVVAFAVTLLLAFLAISGRRDEPVGQGRTPPRRTR